MEWINQGLKRSNWTAARVAQLGVLIALGVTVAGNGTVTKDPNLTTFNHGETVQLTATADPGWYFAGWSGDTSGTASPVTLTMTANRSVTATFANIPTFTISASAGAGGTVTPSGSVVVAQGGDTTIAIAPNAHYHIDSVIVDGVNEGAITSRTFTNLQAAHTLAAIFSIDTYTITVTQGANGVIIPDSVTGIGSEAFPHCRLRRVTIPRSVDHNGLRAFSFCTSLTNVTIGRGVTFIGWYAFEFFVNLTSVCFLGDAPSIGDDVFSYTNNATVYYLPGTMGWCSTSSGRPTSPWLLPNPVILDFGPSFGVRSNQFGFIISWATNRAVVLESSTTLSNPNWSPLATNTLMDGWSYFSDPQWTNYPTRFYRVRSQ